MKIELICPTWTEKVREKRAKRHKVFKYPPLGLLSVAAVTPPDVKVSLTDENVQTVDFNKDVDLVGISVMTSSAPRAYEIADEFRKKGVPVVLGGPHVTFMPEEAIQHADAVVLGEAEGIWEKLLEDFRKKGKKGLKKFYKAEKKPDLSKIPFPRWDILDKGKYIFYRMLHLTRGCPYSCSFCTVSRFFGRKMRFRPIDKVVEFIKKNIGENLTERVFGFLDDNIMGYRKYAKELFKALAPLKIIWFSQSSIDAAYDEELLQLAAKSGCKGLFVGLETLSQSGLDEVGKKQNKLSFYREAIKRFHDAGIFVEGAFMFGLDKDGKDVFEKTVKFVNSVKLDGVQYTILTPLPGSKLYEEMKREKRLIDRDWSNYDCGHPVFLPKNLTPEELYRGLAWAYKKTYSFASILFRSTGLLRGGRLRYLIPFLVFNLGYRSSCKHMFSRAYNPTQG